MEFRCAKGKLAARNRSATRQQLGGTAKKDTTFSHPGRLARRTAGRIE
jgi:uncharacterized membrane protein